MAEAGIWKETFRVRSYETDATGCASVETMCNYLQEAAGNHAFALGVSVEQLHEQDMTWVLARLHVRVEVYPHWRDEVTVETWPSGVEGLFATRDFLMLDTGGRVLVRATSGWLMIDVRRRRPVRIPDSIASLALPDRPRTVDDMVRQLPDPQTSIGAEPFPVRYGDLDVNGHVNNVRYVAWGLEALPPDMREAYGLTELDAHFRAEAFANDAVAVRAEPSSRDTREWAHVILQADEHKELARLRTAWERR